MNPKKRLAGRFLPSRVYARWLGTVRFGLVVLPLIVFLSGSLTLYLSPNRYKSTAIFAYLGPRPKTEAAGLLKTHGVIDLAVAKLKLNERFGTDSMTTAEIVADSTKTSIDPDSGFIEVNVTHTQKDVARDIAEELIHSLDQYEKILAGVNIQPRIHAAQISLANAEEEAATKRQDLQRLISVRGDPAANPVAQLDIDALKSDWANSRQRIIDSQVRIDEAKNEIATLPSMVMIHSYPDISQSPFKKAEDSLGTVIWQSIALGLSFALGAPYLLELAFPRRRSNPTSPAKEFTEDDYEDLGIGAPVEI